MNPDAHNFVPLTSNEVKRGQQQQQQVAWSNPARSVNVVKNLPQNNSPQNWATKSGQQQQTRVLPKPVVTNFDRPAAEEKDGVHWTTVISKKERKSLKNDEICLNNEKEIALKKDDDPDISLKNEELLSEEDLELKRQRRRERRQREKEFKKKRKEDEKLRLLKGPQGTKIKVIGEEVLKLVKSESSNLQQTSTLNKVEKLRFFEEEYPSLSSAAGLVKPQKTASLASTASIIKDSGSEWETEDETDENISNVENYPPEKNPIEVISTETKSYISILKKNPVQKIAKPQLDKVLDQLSDELHQHQQQQQQITTTKKVKRKDPIQFDLFQAIKTKKKPPSVPIQPQKPVFGSKLVPNNRPGLPSSTVVRNILDSSAPSIRRGKEREKPKKKKQTKMRKVILADRQARREERLANLALSQKTMDVFGQSPVGEPVDVPIDVSVGEPVEVPVDVPVDVPVGESVGVLVVKEDLVDQAENKLNCIKGDIPVVDIPVVGEPDDTPLDALVNLTVDETPGIPVKGAVDKNIVNIDKPVMSVGEPVDVNVRKPFDTSVNSTVDKTPGIPVLEPVDNVDEPAGFQLAQPSNLEKAKLLLHNRKFRDYCDHDLSGELDLSVIALIQDLVRFQDRQFAKDPMKAKSKKRYVVGLREIKKFLQVKKITILLLAPDVEPVTAKGGLNDVIAELVQLAKDNEVPYAFTLNRQKLSKACLRKVRVSGIGVLNHQGSDENFSQITNLLPVLKSKYGSKLENALHQVNPNYNPGENSTMLKVDNVQQHTVDC